MFYISLMETTMQKLIVDKQKTKKKDHYKKSSMHKGRQRGTMAKEP